MSDRRLSPGDGERTARVWQPSDFYHLGPDGGFVAKHWRDDSALRFQRSDTPTVTRPAPRSDAQAAAADTPAVRELPQVPAASALPQPAESDPDRVSRKELEDARVQAYAKGQEHGREEARRQFQEASQTSQQRLREHIDTLAASLDALRLQPEKIHEPLKRLALHLAEQLVLGELTQSPQAIERLVRRCVEELGSAAQAPVRIDLHPDDLALLQPWLAAPPGDEPASGDAARKTAPPWQLVPDEGLRPGSVRASANDAVVTDLIEHRLDVMARQLLLDGTRVAQQSAFRPERLVARRAEVDAVLDAQPRMADPPRQSRFSPVVDTEAAVTAAEPAPAQAAEPQDAPAPQPDAANSAEGEPA